MSHMFLSEAIPSQGELLESMQARLNEFLAEKSALQKELEKVDIRLKELYGSQGPRLRDSEEDIDKQIKDLEYNRTTRTMSLQEEKNIIRKMDDLKRMKPKIRAYKAGEEELAGLKRQKSTVFDSIKSREATISELNQGIKKLQLAQRVGVSASELMSVTVEIPEAFIARVIGKGGQNLKQIEESCKVSIDVVDNKRAAKITGGAVSCDLARQRIEEITLAVVEDAPLTENLIAVLLFQRGQLSQALQAKYNVRVDVMKAEGVLRLTGLPEMVAQVKDAIADLDLGSESVTVDPRLIPSVVGKGGSNFRKLEEDFSVSLDIDRADNAIVVRGLMSQVERAADELRRIIETNEDKEETVKFGKFVERMLMEDKASLLKELRKETGCLVFMRSEKEDAEGTAVIKGPSFKLSEGVEAFKKLVAELTSKMIEVVVDPELIGVLIGKKGATITKLRQDTGAVIETEMGSGLVKICSRDEAKIEHAKAEILSLIEKNQLSDVSLAKESALAMKTSKGTELRDHCANTLQVNLDIDSDNGIIRLRGPVEAMEEAKARILAFAEENFGVEMDLMADDFSILTAGGAENSLKKQIQETTGATLLTIKEEGVLKIRGSRTAVAEAEAAVKKALDGDDDGRTVLVNVTPDALPFLIGKSGASINKLREDLGVDLTVLRVRSQIRLRGEEPEKVQEASVAVTKYLAELRGSFTVKANQTQQQDLEDKMYLQRLAREYDVSMDRTNDTIRLRGLVREAAGANGRLTEFISGRSKLVLPMPASIMNSLLAQGDGNWKRIREGFAVSAEVDKVNSAIVLQGPVAGVSKAKDYVFQMLELLFPTQFAAIAVPLGSMPNLAALVLDNETPSVEAWPDREKDLMRFWADQQEGVMLAVAKFQTDIRDWELTHAIVSFEGWMYPLLIGKGGGRIKELEKTLGTQLTVDREAGLIKLNGTNAEEVASAATQLNELVDNIRKENGEVEVPREAIPALIGKKGANLAKIREESGAQIDVPNASEGRAQPKTVSVRIRAVPGGATGLSSEEQVAKAKAAIITHIAEWTKNNALQEVPLTPEQFALVSGKNGATARQIADESGAKLELNKEKGVVTIKGKAGAVSAAQAAVFELLDEDRDFHLRAAEEKKEQEALKAAAKAAAPPAPKPVATSVPAQKVEKKLANPAANKPVAQDNAKAVTPTAGAASGEGKKKSKDKKAAAPSPQPEDPVPEVPSAKQLLQPNGATNTASAKKTEAAAPVAKTAVKEVVKADKASELLDLMLGRKPTAGAGKAGAGATGGSGKKEDSQYYKSSSGLTVRL